MAEIRLTSWYGKYLIYRVSAPSQGGLFGIFSIRRAWIRQHRCPSTQLRAKQRRPFATSQSPPSFCGEEIHPKKTPPGWEFSLKWWWEYARESCAKMPNTFRFRNYSSMCVGIRCTSEHFGCIITNSIPKPPNMKSSAHIFSPQEPCIKNKCPWGEEPKSCSGWSPV